MNLYLLERCNMTYGAPWGFVVRAESEKNAACVCASEEHSDYDWHTADITLLARDVDGHEGIVFYGYPP